MIIITSSAKTLDEKTDCSHVHGEQPLFLNMSERIHTSLAKKSKEELQEVLHANDKITELNFNRYKSWKKDHSSENSRPALFMYKGDIFRQMHPLAYSEDQLKYAHKTLRVMSGLYGSVRALDLIQPYRLEMAAKIDSNEKLSDQWRESVTEQFNKEDNTLVNLASKEYADAVDFDTFNGKVITIEFKEERDGKLQNLGILAKRARGMMIEYAIQNKVEDPKELQKFTEGGYAFAGETSPGVWLFTR